ncbi:S-layer protein [Paenibacillus campinasensis]|uniref:S-layer protein n=1 Tax=Paenibacillus campinasensis TaxID=66347 RepID=A0ABW9T1J2_9BACL|nr:YcdB/YcdC domain-containing protein [Paenibacillus campinasensis]MUG66989.1 S-layer protein [Paenibacillus campinasensis]
MKLFTARKVPGKKTVCAVAAMLLMAQPAWADTISTTVTREVTETSVSSSNTAGTAITVNATNSDIPEGAKISSEQAEKVIKKLFPAFKGVKVTGAQFIDSDRNKEKSWDLQLSVARGNSVHSFSVRVSAVTGEPLQVYFPLNLLSNEGEGAYLTREEARLKALSWIRENIPSINADDLMLNEAYVSMNQALFSPAKHDFYFKSSVNGIETDSNTITMSLDGWGNVITYYRNAYEGDYPSPIPKKDTAAIRKLYEEQFNVRLAYFPESLYNNRSGNYFLGYVPEDSAGYERDADTGKALNYFGEEYQNLVSGDETIPEVKDAFIPLTSPLTSGEAAAALVERWFSIPDGYELDSKSIGQRWNDGNTSVWNLYWRNNNMPMGPRISAEVDASTGQIYSYSYVVFRYSDQEPEQITNPVSREEAQKVALETVSRLVPNAAEEWKLTSVTGPGNNGETYEFSFQRYAGDIFIFGDALSITIDREGQIQGFNFNASADLSKLPADETPVISAQQAKEKYLQSIELKLKYALYGGYVNNQGKEVENQIRLVYYPHNQALTSGGTLLTPLDAKTGEWKEITPQLTGRGAASVTDITGHPSEAALNELVKHQVLQPDKDGKLHPDRDITLGEWYQLLAGALNPAYELQSYARSSADPYGGLEPDHPYYGAVQVLLGENWLTFDPDTVLELDHTLTREELAVSLTRILKYEKLSRTFTLPSDVPGVSDAASIKNKGAAAITIRLGLLPAVDGKFMPERQVTRAEAAEVLVRLSKLGGQSDSFLSGRYYY